MNNVERQDSWGTILRLRAVLLELCILFIALLPSATSAETYIAGELGGVIPSKLSGLTGDQSNNGATLSDVLMRIGPSYGAKWGHYLADLQWLGMEIEYYQSIPHIKQQTFTRTQAGTSTSGTLTDTSFKMNTIGMNMVLRYPGESWQPYGGIGVGLFSPAPANGAHSTVAGLNLLGGLRYKFGPHLATFGEVKYNRATIDFADPTNNARLFQGTYSAVLFMIGFSFHF